VFGEPLVDEGVVSRQQLHHPAILLDDALEEELSLGDEVLTQVVAEVREDHVVGQCAGDVAKPEPLRGKVRRQRLGAGILQHAAHFAVENRRILQQPFACHVEELIVRNAAPQEERQTRRELQIGQAVWCTCAARIALDAVQER
jgi:hypothetical protein